MFGQNCACALLLAGFAKPPHLFVAALKLGESLNSVNRDGVLLFFPGARDSIPAEQSHRPNPRNTSLV
jgi:hypothetical protein